MKITFIDPVDPALREALTAAGHRCVDADVNDPGTFRDAQGIVVRSSKLGASLLDRAPVLRFIARAGSGLENIDLDHCTQRGIRVYNSPEGNRDGVGETAVMLLLMLLKNALITTDATRRGGWPREAGRGSELHNRTVGIIGYGHMGSAFAERLQGFGARLLACDKYKTGYAPAFVEETTLDRVQDECDVISLHLPLTAETHHFVNAAFIARMARPFRLINTARGPLVDTAALADGIVSGKVTGAGLDVLEQEKPDLSGLDPDIAPAALAQLRSSDRVIITPHIAGVTHEGARKMAGILATKILQDFPHGH